jgi:hypothetical protein
MRKIAFLMVLIISQFSSAHNPKKVSENSTIPHLSPLPEGEEVRFYATSEALSLWERVG